MLARIERHCYSGRNKLDTRAFGKLKYYKTAGWNEWTKVRTMGKHKIEARVLILTPWRIWSTKARKCDSRHFLTKVL